MPDTNASWVGKLPADMTNEELQAAKAQLQDDIVPAQERLNALSAGVTHLDREIMTRFHIAQAGVAPVTSMPNWPGEWLTSQYGAPANS